MKYFKRIIYTLLTLCVVAGAIIFYATKIEPFSLQINTYTMKANIKEELSVVQISDIQISEYYPVEKLEKIVTKINKLEPDIVLFTGDLYENYADYGPEDSVIAMLNQIKNTYGKYAIYGNRDYGGGASRRYSKVMEEAGFTLLVNEGIFITLKNEEKIFLGGLDDSLLSTPNVDQVIADMQEQEANYHILLTHEPDVVDQFKDANFDLVLAGHSHGGQVKIPFFGGITTSLAEKYLNGFYDVSDTMQLYVNTGIGTSRYPIRFLVPPEIARFNLINK